MSSVCVCRSFQDVSMKFENTLRSLKEVINENSFATNVSLVQQSCLALQRLNSVRHCHCVIVFIEIR